MPKINFFLLTYIVILIIILSINTTTSTNELALKLEEEFNKLSISFPSNWQNYISEIKSFRILKFDKFEVNELDYKLQTSHQLNPTAIDNFRSIIYTDSEYFNTFNFSINNLNGGYTEFIGAARKVQNIVEIAYIELITSAKLLPRYENVTKTNCWRFLFLFKKCENSQEIISKGFTMEEIILISEALKAHAYKYLIDTTRNLLSALHQKEFVISQNSLYLSENGKYYLVVNPDGRMKIFSEFKRNGFPFFKNIWTSPNSPSDNQPHLLAIEQSGDLCLYDNSSNIIWRAENNIKGEGPFRLVMQNDGDLVLFGKDNSSIWKSNTVRKS